MDKNSNSVIVALLVLIIGFGAGYFARGAQMPSMGTHMMGDGRIMGDSSMEMGTGNAISDMVNGLFGKSGDEFDKVFLTMMIVHHEGAVEMARAALRDANREEIKDMADSIISAQNAEIVQMREWQRQWYK